MTKSKVMMCHPWALQLYIDQTGETKEGDLLLMRWMQRFSCK
jgi:hypothetical protein